TGTARRDHCDESRRRASTYSYRQVACSSASRTKSVTGDQEPPEDAARDDVDDEGYHFAAVELRGRPVGDLVRAFSSKFSRWSRFNPAHSPVHTKTFPGSRLSLRPLAA